MACKQHERSPALKAATRGGLLSVVLRVNRKQSAGPFGSAQKPTSRTLRRRVLRAAGLLQMPPSNKRRHRQRLRPNIRQSVLFSISKLMNISRLLARAPTLHPQPSK